MTRVRVTTNRPLPVPVGARTAVDGALCVVAWKRGTESLLFTEPLTLLQRIELWCRILIARVL